MKRCQICGHVSKDSDSSCIKCGEASWAWVADIAPVPAPVVSEPKKKQKKGKAAEPVAPAANGISDEEFAEELASATDTDLVALSADDKLPASWQKLIQDEIAKRTA